MWKRKRPVDAQPQLRVKLQRILAASRNMGLAGPAAALEFRRPICGVGGYRKAGLHRFAGKLERASPNLFTFMACEGVEPTNEAEWQIQSPSSTARCAAS